MDMQWEDAETPGREGAERSMQQKRDGRWYISSIALRALAGKVAWIVGYSVFWAVVIGLFVGMGG